MKIQILVFLSFTFLMLSCIDPFDVTTGDKDKLLIVDALISNAEGPYFVSLKYSSADINNLNHSATEAQVTITDNNGVDYKLTHIGDGVYQSPDALRGIIGNSYKLHIENNSKTYESDWCLLREPACIDKAYWEAGSIIANNEEIPALKLMVDASVCSNEETFLKWEVKEDWKFPIPEPSFVEMNDPKDHPPYLFTSKDFVQLYCYKSAQRNEISTYSFLKHEGNKVYGKEVFATSTITSNRFTKRYRATIFQYSISKDEYSFWSKIKEQTEDNTSFFWQTAL